MSQRTAHHSVVIELVPRQLAAFDEQEWADLALCAQTDPEAFFPEKGGSTRAAKKVCVSCEVRTQCLEWAMAAGERFGIFGGLSERERRQLQKDRDAEAAQAQAGAA